MYCIVLYISYKFSHTWEEGNYQHLCWQKPRRLGRPPPRSGLNVWSDRVLKSTWNRQNLPTGNFLLRLPALGSCLWLNGMMMIRVVVSLAKFMMKMGIKKVVWQCMEVLLVKRKQQRKWRWEPNIAEVNMVVATVEFAQLFPSRLVFADIVVNPQPPSRIQLACLWCQRLKQLLKDKCLQTGQSRLVLFCLEVRLVPIHFSLLIFTWNLATELSGAPPVLYLALVAFNKDAPEHVIFKYLPAMACSKCTREPSGRLQELMCRDCR